MKRHGNLARWIGAGLGVIGGFVLGYFMVGVGHPHPGFIIIGLTTLEGLIFAYLGTPYVLGGWRTFNFRLTSTPLSDLLSGVLGMIVGLVIAALIGLFVRDLPYGVALSAILALLLAAQGASLGLTRRSELTALFLGRGQESKSHRLSGVLLDTSVIIDGRILDIAKTGFVDMPLIILSSVLRELQQVADSADATRRRRGRRGLDVLTQMQKDPSIHLQVVDDDVSPSVEIDAHLVRTAKSKAWGIMTNDFNLNRIARLEGVTVLNLNELAQAMRPVAIPGEEIVVTVAREGKEPGQGVGSLDDGTMVVVQNGRRLLNQTITATVTSVIQTSAGRMIFAEPAGQDGRRVPETRPMLDKSPTVGAIVAAAGSGSRLGRGSKALVRLNGRTTLARVLELFLALDEVDRIVVVAPPSRLENAQREVIALHPRKPVTVKAGGESRQASVRAGLAALGECDFVLVHDAARPLATATLVRRVLAAAVESGAAFPAIAPRDAVKRVEGNRLVESLDRTRIVLAQTPQAFAYELLARAHREAADAGLVGDDDAQLVAATGHVVTVVEGEPANIKLTTPEDFEVVEALIREQEAAAT